MSTVVAPIAAAPPGAASRLPFIDLLRMLASHAIVWHHLVFFGPISDVAVHQAPELFNFIYSEVRMAVQVFFVLGGFALGKTLVQTPAWTGRVFLQHTAQRYRRIGLPYLATLGLAIVANEVARRGMTHDSISAPPTLLQLLAHALFLQELCGVEALTAGIWYLAVDFQIGLAAALGTVCVASVWGPLGPAPGQPAFRVLAVVFGIAALAALFWFNRHDVYEDYGIYFFGSVFLGQLAAWTLSGHLAARWFWVYAGLMFAAALHDWRPRLLVALATGIALLVAGSRGWLATWPQSSWVEYWGRRSFSLFLVHFPVALVLNSWLVHFIGDSPTWALAAMLAIYLACLGAAVLFYRFVEAPCVAGKARLKA